VIVLPREEPKRLPTSFSPYNDELPHRQLKPEFFHQFILAIQDETSGQIGEHVLKIVFHI